MRTPHRILIAVLLLGFLPATKSRAQTTAFTYKGNLTDAGVPAAGAHDFEFRNGNSAPAPSPRSRHMAVWTGNELIAWGGLDPGGNAVGEGAGYDPSADRWTPLTALNAPAPRYGHTAVWTGTEMIVWAGRGPEDAPAGDGGRFFPAQNAWVPAAGGPVSYSHSAVWTGSRMLLFRGSDGTNLLNRLWSCQPTPPLVLYQKP